MKQTGDAYLLLNDLENLDNEELSSVLKKIRLLLEQVSPSKISAFIRHEDWRPRLIGIFLVLLSQNGQQFVPDLIESLADPRGLTIVPACAALTRLISRAQMEVPDFSSLDREAFSGAMGWSIDKLRFHCGVGPDPGGRCPNDEKSFEVHLKVLGKIKRCSETS